jgi:DNA polymerase III alpha subunit (gram-positive type)
LNNSSKIVAGWPAWKQNVLGRSLVPYVSIDIETTGLDPETCQILEIGAVWEDWLTPVDRLKTYRRLVVHPEYRGCAYALAMNSELLRELAGPIRWPHILKPEQVAADFRQWLLACGWPGGTLTAAGKNFASFDLQFLNKLPRFNDWVHIRHRVLDPGMLYWHPTDVSVPDTKTCYKRAGLVAEVAHTAVADALGVVKLIRKYYDKV